MRQAVLGASVLSLFLLADRGAAADAPGAPGVPSVWAAAAKEFLGTSTSDASRVYFTGAEGILTEVFYPTLDVVQKLHSRYGCIRAVLQAYLFRTEKDARKLSEAGIPVRLCKGAYNEAGDVAYLDKADVDANYLKIARLLLDEGVNAAIATHDPKMIDGVLAHAREKGYGPNRFEFQMLYGVRRDLQQRLVDQGWKVRLYVPFGSAWYPYFMRRLAERPANVFFILRHLFRK